VPEASDETEAATASNNMNETFPSLIPVDPMHRRRQQQKRGTPQQQQQLPLARSEALEQPAGRAVTMRDQLRELEDVEHNCVMLARRIQYLGFSASTQLEDHFKAFGPVQCVVVPQSHVKPVKPPSEAGSGSERAEPVRQRPANLAFVIMESAAGADAALAAGKEHLIGGATIVMEPFDGTRWKLQKEKLQKDAQRARKQSPPPAQDGSASDGSARGSDSWKHHGAALDC
jgi:hypothetical protein